VKTLLLLALGAALAIPAALPAADADAILFRVRIENRKGGAVEQASDSTGEWNRVGEVQQPAESLSQAPPVIAVAAPGSIAGVAADHLLLRMPAPPGRFRQLRVAARGDRGTTAAIRTDLPPGSPLFRCLAPSLGSSVRLERNGRLDPIPADYLPRAGDRLVLTVPRPPDGNGPTIDIDNRPGGDVTFTATGGIPQLLGKVRQPLRGIGRYTGTERGGSGRVLTWTPTALLVSTAGTSRRGEEQTEEQVNQNRGGFVIQPAEPALRGAHHPASQLLIEAIVEGTPRPAASPLFGLPGIVSSCDPLDPVPTRVQVRIDGGDWEAMPDIRGSVDEPDMPAALQSALPAGRKVQQGITHLRILLGGFSDAAFRRRFALAVAPAEEAPQSGVVRIRAGVEGDDIRYVAYWLDGRQVKLTNVPPFIWEWDTRRVDNGDHLLEIRGLNSQGEAITTATRRITVDN
jgi:hypothetical protein